MSPSVHGRTAVRRRLHEHAPVHVARVGACVRALQLRRAALARAAARVVLRIAGRRDIRRVRYVRCGSVRRGRRFERGVEQSSPSPSSSPAPPPRTARGGARGSYAGSDHHEAQRFALGEAGELPRDVNAMTRFRARSERRVFLESFRVRRPDDLATGHDVRRRVAHRTPPPTRRTSAVDAIRPAAARSRHRPRRRRAQRGKILLLQQLVSLRDTASDC